MYKQLKITPSGYTGVSDLANEEFTSNYTKPVTAVPAGFPILPPSDKHIAIVFSLFNLDYLNAVTATISFIIINSKSTVTPLKYSTIHTR